MKVLWTARSDPSILKEINPEYLLDGLLVKLNLQYLGPPFQRADSLEGLMMKLNLQYFGYLMQRTDSFERTLMMGLSVGGVGYNKG